MIPRSVLAVASAVMVAGVASAITGAALYVFYEHRLSTTEEAFESFRANFEVDAADMLDALTAERDSAVRQVQEQMAELNRFTAGSETLEQLREKVAPSVWFVHVDAVPDAPEVEGLVPAPARVGSAFVAFTDQSRSYLLTSFATVEAASREPVPAIRVSQGDRELVASVVNWDADRDLALLEVQVPDLPALGWAPSDQPAKSGDRVFAVSGLGSTIVSQGFVVASEDFGLVHDLAVGVGFQGGPLVNSNGEVVGVASREFSPLGFKPEAMFFAVPIRGACVTVLGCPDEI